jgi:hypothetical protein
MRVMVAEVTMPEASDDNLFAPKVLFFHTSWWDREPVKPWDQWLNQLLLPLANPEL